MIPTGFGIHNTLTKNYPVIIRERSSPKSRDETVRVNLRDVVSMLRNLGYVLLEIEIIGHAKLSKVLEPILTKVSKELMISESSKLSEIIPSLSSDMTGLFGPSYFL